MDSIERPRNVISQPDPIQIDDFELKEPFVELGRRFSDLPGTVVLLSGGGIDSAKYNILAIYPEFSIEANEQQVFIRRRDESFNFELDPFDALQEVLDHCRIDALREQFGPIFSGLFGYLSYDLKDRIERLPKTTVDDLHLPQMLFYAPTNIIVQEVGSGDAKRIRVNWGSRGVQNDSEITARLASQPVSSIEPYHTVGELKSNFSKVEYTNAIDRIRQYIEAGDIYQVNMSHRFEVKYSGDSYGYFASMFARNPAPFYAYINAGDHQVVSTSPERFVLRDGEYVETRPIKGTCPRSDDPARDEEYKKELLNSRKDEAELSMIVDLLRNDLGKVCQAGTVKVEEHKRLEAYQNVYHLVSTIIGRLSDSASDTCLIKALFPGGSITGCPKIRSMEIIDEQEQYRRHIYTGSIGYVSFHGTMDFSIAIRTATIVNDRLIFSVGGAIVYDSEPESEHAETLSKGQTMITHLVNAEKDRGFKDFVWMNGKVVKKESASIPIDDQGLTYGYGIFETIRAEKGEPLFLDRHISRLQDSYKALFGRPMEAFTWRDIIHAVLERNELLNESVAIKIIVSGDNADSCKPGSNVAVTARKYLPRFPKKNGENVCLLTYPDTRDTWLADHKTLNYLFYHLAGDWAKNSGVDEALVLNSDQTISETNSANILIIRQKKVIRPKSNHVLPGITETVVCGLLEKRGYDIVTETLWVRDLKATDKVIITNSLIGARSVGRLDALSFLDCSELTDELNDVLLYENERL